MYWCSLFTSTQAATCRELLLSLVLQFLLEGRNNPLQLLHQPRYQYVGASLQKATTFSFFQGPRFINFQTGSMNIKQSSRINQSPFHKLDLNQVDTSLIAVPKTQYQKAHTRKQNPEHNSNRQKQLDHNLEYIRYFNSLKLACIRFCVWNNLRIRLFTSQNLRVYAPSLH